MEVRRRVVLACSRRFAVPLLLFRTTHLLHGFYSNFEYMLPKDNSSFTKWDMKLTDQDFGEVIG
jgi:hypothetical protein